MRRSVKTVFVYLLAVCLLCVCSPQAAVAGGYQSIYSADNPVPEISKNVRPSVVQVIGIQEMRMRRTGERVNTDASFGSGVYIDARGYIVTNYHVIADAQMVDIKLLDGTRMPVSEFYFDQDTDIALLKVDEPLPGVPVPMGDSNAIEIGDLTIVIGNPSMGDSVFAGTVTVGIISALDRTGINDGNFRRTVQLIQTDAAINSGNSGGAMLNRNGELIGIPTLKIMSDWNETYEGLGFAIPINTVKPIVDELIEFGTVRRPRMGVTMYGISGPDTPMYNRLPAGIYIEAVDHDGPAMRAGVHAGDVVTHIDDVRVRNEIAMSTELEKHAAGDTVVLTVCRYEILYGMMTGAAEILDIPVELMILD